MEGWKSDCRRILNPKWTWIIDIFESESSMLDEDMPWYYNEIRLKK